GQWMTCLLSSCTPGSRSAKSWPRSWPKLVQVRGALLFYSCVPVSEFSSSWPKGVPVQIHGMDADPYFVGEGDIGAARALVNEAEDAELFLYPGDQHYFADSTLPSYDADAAALLKERVLGFLSSS